MTPTLHPYPAYKPSGVPGSAMCRSIGKFGRLNVQRCCVTDSGAHRDNELARNRLCNHMLRMGTEQTAFVHNGGYYARQGIDLSPEDLAIQGLVEARASCHDQGPETVADIGKPALLVPERADHELSWLSAYYRTLCLRVASGTGLLPCTLAQGFTSPVKGVAYQLAK